MTVKNKDNKKKETLISPSASARQVSKIKTTVNTIKNKKIIIISTIIFGIIIATLAILTIGIYKYQWSGVVAQKAIKIIPYPAVAMKGKNISQNYFIMRVNSQKHYYQSQKQLDLNQPEKTKELQELKEKTRDTLIKERFIQYTLSKRKVAIIQKEVDQEFANSSAGKSQEQVEDKIQTLYGWTTEEFKQELIKPYLEKQKLQKIIIFDKEINKEQIKKAKAILEELKKDADFAELADKYSEDPGNYPEKGGDLGWIAKGQMVEEFEQAAFALEQTGQLSEIVATKFGFHIIKLEEKQSNRIHARHILIKPHNFNQWLEQEIVKEKIWQLNLDLL